MAPGGCSPRGPLLVLFGLAVRTRAETRETAAGSTLVPPVKVPLGRLWEVFGMLSQVLQNALQGKGAHVNPTDALDGLDWVLAGQRPAGSPHTIWEILQHMIFWQDFFVAWIRGERPSMPATAAESWPDRSAPKDAVEWESAVARFKAGLTAALAEAEGNLEATLTGSPGHTRAEALIQLIGHNSYHLGQIVLLRRLLGAWPPPGGGDTW